MSISFLKCYKAKLRVLTPTHIGCKQLLTRSEYLWNETDKKIYIPDPLKIYELLTKYNLLDSYEELIFKSNRGNGLMAFFLENRVPKKEVLKTSQYSIRISENFSTIVSDINLFIKDGRGDPYIPGSSLKGALRTALLAHFINKLPDDRRKFHENDFVKKLYNNENSFKRIIQNDTTLIEAELLPPLKYNSEKISALHDALRGIRVSDSLPVSNEHLGLCWKYDVSSKKAGNYQRRLNLVRECVLPGAEANLVITIDEHMLKDTGIDMPTIILALQTFSKSHETCFESSFKHYGTKISLREGEAPVFLGGGVGYVSKTLTYPLIKDHAIAVDAVAAYMRTNYPRKHSHEKDPNLRISPHMNKLTISDHTLLPMGRCALSLQEIEPE